MKVQPYICLNCGKAFRTKGLAEKHVANDPQCSQVLAGITPRVQTVETNSTIKENFNKK